MFAYGNRLSRIQTEARQRTCMTVETRRLSPNVTNYCTVMTTVVEDWYDPLVPVIVTV